MARLARIPRLVKLSAIPVALVAAAGVYLAADWWIAVPDDRVASYVGGQTCAKCHEKEHERWVGSHHDLAMDVATDQTVLGNFDDQEFTYAGLTSKMYRRDGKYFFETENADGKLQEFEVKYVFGHSPLQQYMVEFDQSAGGEGAALAEGEVGRIQVLPIAWDTVAKRWFHLYPDEEITAGDPLHWTGPAQNWNYMCADCHSTNLHKGYDLASNSYHTTFSEIDVSCEACHGPGSIHVELAEARSPFWDRKRGYGLAKLKGDDPTMQLETCARCHSRRRIVHDDYRPGGHYSDFFGVETLQEGLYHADGQIDDEVYVWGSFLQSEMYHKGVRCTDCHDPHTTGPRLDEKSGQPLLGNALCTRCHTPGKYDTPAHHHHVENLKLADLSPADALSEPDRYGISRRDGTLCVDCHMPHKNYMVVDPRRDHSLRNPRPDLSVLLGTPNACNQCHTKENENAQWAAAKIVEWFGPKRPDDPHYAPTLAAARDGQPEAYLDLLRLIANEQQPAIVRATALGLLRAYPTGRAVEAVKQSLKDPSENVRFAALGVVDDLPPDLLDVAELPELVGPLLKDPRRLVRGEAARVMAKISPDALGERKEAFEKALDEYQAGQLAVADRGAAHLNLALLHERMGADQAAERAYQTAIRVEPNIVGPRSNLAGLYDRKGRKDEAHKLREQELKLYERDVGYLPDNAQLQYRYGLLKYTLGDMAGAEAALQRATQIDPRFEAARSMLVLLYQKLGQDEKIAPLLEGAMEQAPALVGPRGELAGLYDGLNRTDEAGKLRDEELKLIDTQLAATPDDARLWYLRGLVLMGQSRRDDALSALRKAWEIAPATESYQRALLGVLAATRSYAETIELLKQTIQRAPDRPGPRQQLARVYREIGNPAAARELLGQEATMLENRLKLTPRDPWLHYDLGRVRLSRNEPAAAERALRQTQELDPSEPAFLELLLQLYLQQRRWTAARPLARQLAEMQPDNPQYAALVEQLEGQLDVDEK